MSANASAVPETPPKGANTIVIACKLPVGMKLEVGRVGEPGYRTYTLKGTRRKGAFLDPTGTFALTTIPKDFWEEWMAYIPTGPNGKPLFGKPQNPSHPHLRSGAIYAHTETESVHAHAAAYQSLRTGYEPLTQKDMPAGVEPLKNS